MKNEMFQTEEFARSMGTNETDTAQLRHNITAISLAGLFFCCIFIENKLRL